MQFLRDKKLVETTADDFFHALSMGTNSTIAFLQTMHNDALGMGWIPSPIFRTEAQVRIASLYASDRGKIKTDDN